MIKRFLDTVQIFIPDKEYLLSQSHGEVVKTETYHYRSLKPIRGGLFCEVIFGPEKDRTCACDKTYFKNSQETVCKDCGVKIARKSVRKVFFGHMKLPIDVISPLFYRCPPYILSSICQFKKEATINIVEYDSTLFFKEDNIKDFKIISDKQAGDD